jgi:hypothetical protein
MKEGAITTHASGLPDIAERLGKGIGLLSAAALVLSVFYDYNFLLALGLQFSEIPTGIADHLRSAIVWLPGWAPVLALFALLELLTRRMLGFNPAAERTRRHEDLSIYAFMGLVIIYGIFFSTSYSSLYFIFFFGWSLATVWAMGHPRFRAKFNLVGALAFLLVPMLMTMVGGLGYGRGEEMLNATKPTWKIKLKEDEKMQDVEVLGLRRFAEVAIFVTPDKRVQVVRADQVISATTLEPLQPRKALVCRWFPVTCGFGVPGF